MSTRDISAHIHEIYGYELSAESISAITDKVLERAKMVLPSLNKHKVVFDALLSLFPNALESDPFYIYIKTSEILFIMDFLHRPALLADALKQIGIYERICEQFESININLQIVPPSCKSNSKIAP